MPAEHAHWEIDAGSIPKTHLDVVLIDFKSIGKAGFIVSINRKFAKNVLRTFFYSIIPGLALTMILVCSACKNAKAMQSVALPEPIAPPHGFKTSGPPEIYGPQTLYKKINGQAELYLSAGFVVLKSQWYASLQVANATIEVNMYHMGSLLNAFSVFSLQQREDALSMDLTRFSYGTENAVYLVHGPYYVELVSAEPSNTAIKNLSSMAKQFVQTTSVKKENIRELDLFPTQNLVQNSISLISEDAFGLDSLNKVFTAGYMMGDGSVTAYISNRGTPGEAGKLVDRLYAYFLKYGGKDTPVNVAIPGARLIEMMDAFYLMFSMDEYLAGVHEAINKKQAEQVAKMLAEALQMSR
jgi:hypothetical protein